MPHGYGKSGMKSKGKRSKGKRYGEGTPKKKTAKKRKT